MYHRALRPSFRDVSMIGIVPRRKSCNIWKIIHTRNGDSHHYLTNTFDLRSGVDVALSISYSSHSRDVAEVSVRLLLSFVPFGLSDINVSPIPQKNPINRLSSLEHGISCCAW